MRLLTALIHRTRCYFSPTYNANAWAADLRDRGYEVRPGDYLAGVRVTK